MHDGRGNEAKPTKAEGVGSGRIQEEAGNETIGAKSTAFVCGKKTTSFVCDTNSGTMLPAPCPR